jgi:hypothetical protein
MKDKKDNSVMSFLASGPGREKSPVAGRVASSGCQKTQPSRLSRYRKIPTGPIPTKKMSPLSG